MPHRQPLIAGYMKRVRSGNNSLPQQPSCTGSGSGLSPHTFVISGFESAPSPEIIFGISPDEILQHREIGALVAPYDSNRSLDPYSSAAKFEYALEVAQVRNIVVLGNTSSKCLSYLAEGTAHTYMSGWMEIARNALERARYKAGKKEPDGLKMEILHQTALQSVRNLLTYPSVYKAVKRGQLTLNAWYYSPEQDLLYAYNPEPGIFEAVCIPVTNTDTVRDRKAAASSCPDHR